MATAVDPVLAEPITFPLLSPPRSPIRVQRRYHWVRWTSAIGLVITLAVIGELWRMHSQNAIAYDDAKALVSLDGRRILLVQQLLTPLPYLVTCSVLNRLLNRRAVRLLLGELQYEPRNDSRYRPDCVLAWWRRLVLAARARLT